jgi:DNA-binding XRE family transcriptional regulator
MAATGFGFSFGDLVQAINLLNDVRKAFKESCGAVDEFQQVLTDLQQLEIVLRQLDRGGWDGNSDAGHTNAVKGMALTCQVPLRAFLDKIKKYHVINDQEKKGIKLHVTSGVRKVEWAVKMKEEVARFRAVILSKIVTLSLLLALPMLQVTHYCIARMAMLIQPSSSTLAKIDDRIKTIEESVDYTKEKLATKIDEHRKSTTRLEDNVKTLQNVQVAVSFNTRRLLKICAGIKVGFEGFRQLSITQQEKVELQLKGIEETQRKCMDMVPIASLSVGRYIGKLGTRLEKLIEYFGGYTAEILQILRRMIRTDLEMYSLLRQIMDELPRAPRFPKQNCIEFTDVLGRNELLPYQWFQDWEVFESMLKVKFKDLPGERSVKNGQYVMLDTTRRDHAIDVHFWKQSVFPGSSITMSVIVTGQHFIRGACPRPDCDAKNDADRQLISSELTVW